MTTGLYATFNDTELDLHLKSLQAKVARSDSVVAIECRTVTDHMAMYDKLSPVARHMVLDEIRIIQREKLDRQASVSLISIFGDSYRVLLEGRTEPPRPATPQVITLNITILPPDDFEGGDGDDPGPSSGAAARPSLYLVK